MSACLTYFGGSELAGFFEKDPAVITAAGDYLRGGSFEYLFLSVSYCFQGYFNGMGKTRFVMCLALITAFFVRIPLTYYFSRRPLVSMFDMGMTFSVSAGAGMLFCLLYYRWNDGRSGV
ncbi:MATE family efflux transporter [Lachnospiraceae bacterium 54-53]